MSSATSFLPLSSAQRLILLEVLGSEHSAASTIACLAWIHGSVDEARLRRALGAVAREADALRLRFSWSGGEVVMQLAEPEELVITERRFARVTELLETAERRASSPMPFIECPLMDVTLMRAEGRLAVQLRVHHIVGDATSLMVFARRVIQVFDELAEGRGEGSGRPIASYLEAQRRAEEHAASPAGRRAWQSALDELGPLEGPSPLGVLRHGGHSRGVRLTEKLAAEETRKVLDFLATTGSTINRFTTALMALVVARVTRRSDVVIGNFAHNRHGSADFRTFGMFVNPVPVRIVVDRSADFATHLAGTTESINRALKRSRVPLETLLAELGRGILFDTVVSHQFQTFPATIGGVPLELVWQWNGHSPYALQVHVSDRQEGGELAFEMDFRSEVFEPGGPEEVRASLMAAIRALLRDDFRTPVGSLPLISEEQAARLRALHGPVITRPFDALSARIHRRATERPSTDAVVAQDDGLDFERLDARARALAAALRERGVGPGDVVALLLDRDHDWIAAPLGVLYAGAAYLPLDAGLPDGRIDEMLADARPALCLAASSHLSRAKSVPSLDVAEAARTAPLDAPVPVQARDLAYLIYTSGSTGVPKAVLVDHGNLACFHDGVLGAVPLAETLGDRGRVLSTTAISFDIFVLESWTSLAEGRTVVVAGDDAQRDPVALAETIARNACDVAQLTPTRLELLLSAPNGPGALAGLKFLLVGGEAMPEALLADVQRRAPAVRIFNMYGPTETTVWSTVAELTRARTVVIGKAIADTDLFILDDDGQPVPPGFPGELVIGGGAVTRGYHGRPGLTASRFVPSLAREGERAYRTGDLVRLGADGLVHLGRMDHQVKLRGHRIELGEIEGRIVATKLAKAAAVLVKKLGGKELLVAYVVPASDDVVERLGAALREVLPGYMVPQVFDPMDALPLLSSGKIDRGALLARPLPRGAGAEPEAATTPAEVMTLEIVRQVLGEPALGVTDDFAQWGASSLQIARIAQALSGATGRRVNVATVFRARSVRALATELDRDEAWPAAPDVERTAPATAAQTAMLLAAARAGDDGSYHMTGGLRSERPLDRARLSRALASVGARHAATSIGFELAGEGWVMTTGAPPSLEILPSVASVEDAVRALRRPFDLRTGPLVRVAVAPHRDGGDVLAVDVHHAVADAHSLEVLLEELVLAYEERPLPPVSASLLSAAAWEAEVLRSDAGRKLAQQSSDRLRALAPFRGFDELLTHAERAEPRAGTNVVRRRQERALVAAMSELGASAGASAFSVWLSLFAVLLSRHGGGRKVLVATPMRNRVIPALERTAGPLVTQAILPLEVDEENGVIEHAKRTASAVREAMGLLPIPSERALLDARLGELTNTMFLFDERRTTLAVDGGVATLWESAPEVAKVDVCLRVALDPDGSATLEWLARPGVLSLESLSAIADRFEVLVTDAVAHRAEPLVKLRLLSARDQTWLASWSARPDADGHGTVIERLEELAHATPGATAAEDDSETVTFGELHARATDLARRLRARGLGPETRVAILAHPSVAMYQAVLGVLRAGAAYVPLDPGHPEARLARLVERSRSKVLVVDRPHASRVAPLVALLPAGVEVLVVDDPADVLRDDGPLPLPAASSLAYVIYTSGTTGEPKGVMIEHAQLAAQTRWLRSFFADFGALRHAFFVSPAVDVSAHQLFLPLVRGDALTFPDRETLLSPPAMRRYVRARKLDVVDAVPSYVREFLRAGEESREADDVVDLQVLSMGGDVLPPELLRAIGGRTRARRVVNYYGPTETCLNATAWQSEHYHDVASVPIGWPCSGYHLMVVDAYLRETPPGIAGEIVVAGSGVGRGYDDDAEATARAFVPSTSGEGRMYRTGDRGTFRGDGTLAFAGRADTQVKIRGFRVEIGEVEEALVHAPGVAQAAAGLRSLPGRPEPVLAAYLVAEPGAVIDVPQVRQALRERLPAHMCPTIFAVASELPLTERGKIDRPRLAAIALEGHEGLEPDAVARHDLDASTRLLMEVLASLLGRDDIDPGGSFFDQGGDSLLAMRLAAKVHERTGGALPIAAIFRAESLFELGKAVVAPSSAAAAPPAVPASPPEYAATDVQARLIVLDRIDRETPLYNIQGYLELTGEVDGDALAWAIEEVTRRHEVFRTSYHFDVTGAVARVAPSGALSLERIEAREPSADEREVLRAYGARPFSLERAPLARAALVSFGDDRHALALALHHVIADGWTVRLLIEEIAAVYRARRAGERVSLAEPWPFSAYAASSRSPEATAARDGNVAWFAERLQGVAPLELPIDRPRPATPSYRGARTLRAVPAATWSSVRAFARRAGTTPFVAVLAAFAAVLGRRSNRDDFTIGTPVANREDARFAQTAGCFVTTLPLRVRPRRDLTVLDFVHQLGGSVKEALAHQDVSFEALVAKVEPARDLRLSPLVQVLFTLDDTPELEIALPSVTVRAIEPDVGIAKFDLSLGGQPAADGSLELTFEYATDLFDRATVSRLADHVLVVLDAMVEGGAQRLGAVRALGPDDRRILDGMRFGELPPSVPTVLENLLDRASRDGDRPALVSARGSRSYRAVLASARALAAELLDRGVTPEERVGVLTADRELAVVAFLGVLLAGGAYVPLDPSYPAARLERMVRASGARFVVAGAADSSLALGPELLPFDPWTAHARDVTLPKLHPDQAAYVIFTSGSTGEPKGVVVAHRALASFSAALAQACALDDADRSVQMSSLSFDGSAWDIYPLLAVGGSIAVPSGEDLSTIDGFLRFVAEHGVTRVNVPTSFFNAIAARVAEGGKIPRAVRSISIGGEALPVGVATRFAHDNGGRSLALWNDYGPTETTVVATTVDVLASDWVKTGKVPIGRALASTSVYVLDDGLEHVAVGSEGELFIGGPAVARGYLGDPTTSAARFLPDPFAGAAGARMYRTGDRVRVAARGELEFVGRVDDQVKFRGYRVQLSEIERRLTAHPAVSSAVAIVHRGAVSERIVAYVTASALGEEAALRAFVAEELPPFMVPAQVVRLDVMPITKVGKIDRAALPAPPEVGRVDVTPPATETERALASMLEELLGVSAVGQESDFFELGGHSLLAMQVVARVAQSMGKKLELRAIFESPSLRALAEAVDRADAVEAEVGIKRADRSRARRRKE